MTLFKKPSDKLESLIGAGSEFRGTISVSGTLRIDGKFYGNADAGWIVIGEGALIKGDISASGIFLGGRVEGNLRAVDIVEIKPTGELFGDVCTKKLVISEGGIFVGRSDMHNGETKLIALASDEASAG